jgi:hypothetical protein
MDWLVRIYDFCLDNFMDYSDDSCMNNFTPMQGIRMKSQLVTYRNLTF